MKQFATKLAPHLKPFFKKFAETYLKKQLTTDENMNEKQQQFTVLQDKENQKTDNEKQINSESSQLSSLLEKEKQKTINQKNLDDILLRALKPRKFLDSSCLSTTENKTSGLIVGSLRKPSYLEFLLRDRERQQQQPFNYTLSLTVEQRWQLHVNTVQSQGYDRTLDIFASNFRFDNENEEKERSR
jgi:hypothetical protein